MASNADPADFATFMDGVARDVIALILSRETGNVTIHVNGANGLRREINRRGELVQLGAVEIGELRAVHSTQK